MPGWFPAIASWCEEPRRWGFRPDVVSNDITLLYHGAVPKPVPATYQEMIRVQRNNVLVTVHAVVRSADLVLNPKSHVLSARISMRYGGR